MPYFRCLNFVRFFSLKKFILFKNFSDNHWTVTGHFKRKKVRFFMYELCYPGDKIYWAFFVSNGMQNFCEWRWFRYIFTATMIWSQINYAQDDEQFINFKYFRRQCNRFEIFKAWFMCLVRERMIGWSICLNSMC